MGNKFEVEPVTEPLDTVVISPPVGGTDKVGLRTVELPLSPPNGVVVADPVDGGTVGLVEGASTLPDGLVDTEPNVGDVVEGLMSAGVCEAEEDCDALSLPGRGATPLPFFEGVEVGWVTEGVMRVVGLAEVGAGVDGRL